MSEMDRAGASLNASSLSLSHTVVSLTNSIHKIPHNDSSTSRTVEANKDTDTAQSKQQQHIVSTQSHAVQSPACPVLSGPVHAQFNKNAIW